MNRLAIFDLDGTLVDSRHDLADAGNAARAALGLPPLPLERIVGMIGDGAGKLIERLTPGCSAEQRARAMAAFRADYATRLTAHTRPYPGIPEALQALRARGWRLAVATNKPLAFAAPIIERLGLPCDALRGGDATKKPDPAMLEELLAACAAERAQSWMIGDHHTDLWAAQAAGLRAAFCAWGFGQRGEAPATAVVASPAELLAVLDG
ncbi:MAG: HAD-IA family hydrolase [Planctomycetota bacterium]|nr:HAD-IA family hydrolase [Planctomycetota bacterium]